VRATTRTSREDYWSPLYTLSVTRHYEAVVTYARDAGLIRNDVDVKSLIKPEFVAAGLKQLDLGTYWVARAGQ
jgi:hypothetical protein